MRRPVRVVLLGAGHSHLDLIRNASRLHRLGARLTVVDRHDYFRYSGAVPAVIGGMADTAAVEIATRQMALDAGVDWLTGEVSAVDAHQRRVTLADGRELEAEILSVALGSRATLPFPVDAASHRRIVPVKPLVDLLRLPDRVEGLLAHARQTVRVLVVGGGASAVEVTANLAARRSVATAIEEGRLHLNLLARSERLLGGFPARAGSIARTRLAELGVSVSTRCTVLEAREGRLRCSDGRAPAFDLLVLAAGLSPSPPRGLETLGLAQDGALPVDRTLASSDRRIFGGGDAVCVGGACAVRTGVYAIRQGPVLTRNIEATVGWIAAAARGRDGHSGRLPARFEPPARYLLILNLGGGEALAVRGRWVMRGSWWMRLKERIDWAFVASGGASTLPLYGAPPRSGEPRRPFTDRAT